jgi:glycine betaine/choline ABC-type transport system substrate-binding protein
MERFSCLACPSYLFDGYPGLQELYGFEIENVATMDLGFIINFERAGKLKID